MKWKFNYFNIIIGDHHRLAYYTERIDQLQQIFIPMESIFTHEYVENLINSLQHLRNQLIEAMEYTSENGIESIQTVKIIKTNGRPWYQISKNMIISLANLLNIISVCENN